MASIAPKRRPNGRYTVRWRVDGKSRQKDFATFAAAQNYRRELEAAEHAGRSVDPVDGRMTFGAWHAQWTPTRRTAGRMPLRPTTVQKNLELYSSVGGDACIEKRWVHVPLAKITKRDVERWIDDLEGLALASSTIRSVYAEFAGCLRAAVDAEIISRLPTKGVKLPAAEARREMRPLDHDEITKLANAIDRRYRALVLVLAYSGLRIGEATALRRKHVDLARRTVTVTSTAVEVNGRWHEQPMPKTEAGRRNVPLYRKTVRALEDHFSTYGVSDPDDFVFTGPHGAPVRASVFRARAFKTACKQAGLTLRLHDLRHTAVSLWIRSGVDELRLTRWAGHTKVSVTHDIYGHLYESDDAPFLDRLDAAAGD